MKRHALIFGLVGGLLIAVLQYTQYRFVVIEHSIELYGALVAVLFAAFGIWLGLRITRRRETIRETIVVREVLVPAEAPAPFAPNSARKGLFSQPSKLDKHHPPIDSSEIRTANHPKTQQQRTDSEFFNKLLILQL
jgi:hypothetical protein